MKEKLSRKEKEVDFVNKSPTKPLAVDAISEPRQKTEQSSNKKRLTPLEIETLRKGAKDASIRLCELYSREE